MSDVQQPRYIASFALGLSGGVTLERSRAPRGGLHLLRLHHHESGISVERTYDDTEKIFRVQNDLIEQLQAKLSEEGWSWRPAREPGEGTA
jgi:hypothetical protein